MLMGIKRYLIKKYIETEPKKVLEKVSFEEGVDLIYKALMQDSPCMIARFGTIELEAIIRYIAIEKRSSKGATAFWKYVGWDNKRKMPLKNNAGFFSNSVPNIERFCKLMIDNMSNLDILMSRWEPGENLVQHFFPQAKIAPIETVEPYYYNPPWSRALSGKKVLVIHPYTETIYEQYKKRHLLFKDKDVLPDFELITIKAVQSIAFEEVPFTDWFEALEHMKQQIANTDFDIALIGCGAYGFPLASYIKDIGKKAIHIGGATQILFGIKGKRWDDPNSAIQALYNEHWVRPNKDETPQKSTDVEGGCYW